MAKSKSEFFRALTERREKNRMTNNVLAWIDEAGRKGLLHRLSAEDDSDIGLLCSLCVPIEREDAVRASLRPLFDRFQQAFGGVDKVHMTDVFTGVDSKHEETNTIKSELFKFVCSHQLAIFYEACRLHAARRSYAWYQHIQGRTRAEQDPRYAFPNQVDQDRLEVRMAVGLTLKLDLFSYCAGADHLDLYFDHMDQRTFDEILSEIVKRQNATRTVVAKGWDRSTSKPVSRTRTLEFVDEVPVTLLTFRSAQIVRPVDERIFAVDIVANSLLHHLQTLGAADYLNVRGATHGWILSECVKASPTPGIEEIL